jgi:hypothetical protein
MPALFEVRRPETQVVRRNDESETSPIAAIGGICQSVSAKPKPSAALHHPLTTQAVIGLECPCGDDELD